MLRAAKRDVAFVADDMRLYGTATLGWHMKFIASMYPGWDAAYAAALLKRFNLHADQMAKGLSRGEHVKALLLLALARRPRLLVLDEPTSGLDPVARHELLAELMEIVRDESRSILFSSHNTLDVERICDQIAFIDRGELVEARDKESFLERWRRLTVEVPAGRFLPELPGMVDMIRRRAHRHADHRSLLAGTGGAAGTGRPAARRRAAHVARGDLRRQRDA